LHPWASGDGAALSEHPEVIDQVVVPVPDNDWGQRVHAIVQPADVANPPSPDALRAWCRGQPRRRHHRR
jgi:bile acid-coenzyme A ligase